MGAAQTIAEAYDYEGELAVIIGKPGRYIKRAEAFNHVAGYSCYNEGSVREYQGHNRQFGLGKNFERSGSFGPWLMTPDEFGDPADHTLITRLNGIERQHAKISGLLHDMPRLIDISRRVILCSLATSSSPARPAPCRCGRVKRRKSRSAM